MERRISVGIFRPKYVNQLKRWIFRSEEIETNHSIWIPTEISGIFSIMESTQWKYLSKIERHFPIKSGQPIEMAVVILNSFTEFPN